MRTRENEVVRWSVDVVMKSTVVYEPEQPSANRKCTRGVLAGVWTEAPHQSAATLSLQVVWDAFPNELKKCLAGHETKTSRSVTART
jgi:hypothetical protein